jgi:uncharacterized protein YkwD
MRARAALVSLTLLITTAAVGAIASVADAQAVPTPIDSQTERRLLERINKIRRAEGLAALSNDERLSEVARDFSCRLARDDLFGHVSPSGQTFTDRVRAAGRDYRSAAENVAMNVNAKNPVERAVQGWMKSRGHRENILSREFSVSGIGVCARGNKFYFTHIFVDPK